MHTLFQRSLLRARATSQSSEGLLFVSLSQYIINQRTWTLIVSFYFIFLLSDLQMTQFTLFVTVCASFRVPVLSFGGLEACREATS